MHMAENDHYHLIYSPIKYPNPDLNYFSDVLFRLTSDEVEQDLIFISFSY